MAEAAAAATASFPARPERLPDLLGFARDFARRQALPAEAANRLTVVLEELFLNTVHHGHGGGSDAPVSVSLAAAAGRVECRYEDAAPAFAPPPGLPEHIRCAPEARPVGGLGVVVARALASDLRYEAAAGGGNRIAFAIAAGDAAEGG